MMHDHSAARHTPYVTSYTITSALGVGKEATLRAFEAEQGGLRHRELRGGGTTWLGVIEDVGDKLAGPLEYYDCRANRIIRQAFSQDGFMEDVARARDEYGAHRVACFIGTICGAHGDAELCYRHNNPSAGDLGPDRRVDMMVQLFSTTEYCRSALGISGPAATVSTACSSSAKVFCIAQRYLQAGLCDAAVVGGIDCANETLIYGFRSLGLLSTSPCRPWDRRRNGLNLGEGCSLALLEREPRNADDPMLLGYGESGDGYHMTAPHPDGMGAEAAMRAALRTAGLQPEDIDYINLHGSGTPANDASEDCAVLRVFGSHTPCSSTKGWTGHTQGAAGITEAIFSLFSIKHGFMPGMLNTSEPDPKLGAQIVLESRAHPVKRVLSNSFGFGGNNCAVIFGAPQ
jgi:3-oxoacyl-[acyl-carrier-protein] synthase I